MAIAPTVDLFGQNLVTVVMQTTDNFDGVTPTPLNPATIVSAPGRADLPAQSGGGLYDFHNRQIVVHNVVFGSSNGTAGVAAQLFIEYPDLPDSPKILVTTFPSGGGIYNQSIYLSPGEVLSLVSTGSGPKFAAFAAEYCGEWGGGRP